MRTKSIFAVVPRSRAFTGALLGLALAAPGCMTEPITGRKALALIPESQMNELGAQAFQEMLEQEPVSGDARLNGAVEKVGRRIAQVVDEEMAKDGREVYQWEFKVIDNPKVANAFCLPGGKVAFYTGILPICKNEDGIAVVMGHEVAHAYAQHGRSRMSTAVLGQVGLETVQAALSSSLSSETSQLTLAALGVGYQLGVQLPFSRGDESAADEIGLHLMARAGYDPNEAVAFWQRMSQASGEGSPPEFLSTHPDPETRIADLKKLIPKVMPAYEKAKGGGGD